jgi:hypothetical protein
VFVVVASIRQHTSAYVRIHACGPTRVFVVVLATTTSVCVSTYHSAAPVPDVAVVASYVCARGRMLTDADVCWRMLLLLSSAAPVPDVAVVASCVCARGRMLTYADVC